MTPSSGRPVNVATPYIATKVHDMVIGDRRVTERYIASAVWISQKRVYSTGYKKTRSGYVMRRSGYEKTPSLLGTKTSDSCSEALKTEYVIC